MILKMAIYHVYSHTTREIIKSLSGGLKGGKMLRGLVGITVGLLLLSGPGTWTVAAQTHPMFRNLAGENYVQSGDIVVGVRVRNGLEVIVMNLKTGGIFPVMLAEDPYRNLGAEIDVGGLGNFHSLKVKSLREMTLAIYSGDPSGKKCYQYKLDWNAPTKSYDIRYFQLNGQYTNYRTITCS